VSGLPAGGVGDPMIRRSTAVVLVIFVVLLAAAWYLQQDNNSETVDETITPAPVASLFTVPSESLSKVQIEKTGGGRLSIERDEQGIWSFVEPSGHEIDQDQAQFIADNILALTVLSSLEQSPSLEVLGLDKPGSRITMTTSAGEEQLIIIGNLTPTSSGYYVSRMGQIPVIVSKASVDTILDSIENPPIYVTPTPSVTPLITETQIPQSTQIP
jgi:Domain of unknown function (DUF4340)